MPPSYQGPQSAVNPDSPAPSSPAPPAELTDPALLYPGASINLTPVVQALGAIHFEGNIIPHTWYQHALLCFPSDGKLNLVAITLLAEICYWYRPTIVHDEMTGRIKSVSKKFGADKLHWNHEQRASKFGFTKRQVRDAVTFLRDAGLVDVEIRDRFVLPSGAILFNQVFLEPIPSAIRAICGYPAPESPSPEAIDEETDEENTASDDALRSNVVPPTFERSTPHVTTGHPPRSNVAPPTLKREPLTKTTAQTSPETSTDISPNNVKRSTPSDSDKGKSGRPVPVPSAVLSIIDLTADRRSLARFTQLFEICFDNDCLAEWDQAEASTSRALDAARAGRRAPIDRPGAYFQTALLSLLERQEIFVPLASDDRDGTRDAIAQSLAAAESRARDSATSERSGPNGHR